MRSNLDHLPSQERAVRVCLGGENYRARVFLGMRDLPLAEKIALQIQRLLGGNSPADLALARVRWAQGRLATAREILEWAGHRDPGNQEVFKLLAVVEVKHGAF